MPTASRFSAAERFSRCASPTRFWSDPLLDEVYEIAMERVRLPGHRLRVFARESGETTDDRAAIERPNRAPTA